MITVLCYKKCTTCQKAFKWLDAKGVEYKERAIKEENPTYEELKTWYEKSGLPLKKFFNTSGMLYKELGLKVRRRAAKASCDGWNAREASARSRRENGADRIF